MKTAGGDFENRHYKSRGESVAVLRTPVLVAALLWGFYIHLAYRTTEYGFSLRFALASLLISLIYIAPLAILVTFRLRWRRGVLYALVLCLLPILMAECLA